MTYRNYTIIPRPNPAALSRATVYDVYEGERVVKRTFGSVEVARRYVDVVLRGGEARATNNLRRGT